MVSQAGLEATGLRGPRPSSSTLEGTVCHSLEGIPEKRSRASETDPHGLHAEKIEGPCCAMLYRCEFFEGDTISQVTATTKASTCRTCDRGRDAPRSLSRPPMSTPMSPTTGAVSAAICSRFDEAVAAGFRKSKQLARMLTLPLHRDRISGGQMVSEKEDTIVLKRVQVNEYKCVRSTEFDIDPDVTCLVGKNESGKTALLEAIYRLFPIVGGDGRFDVVDDYPRADVEEYEQGIEAGKRHSTVIRAEYELPESLIKSIEAEFGEGVLAGKRLSLSRGYDNELLEDLSVAEPKACAHLSDRAKLPDDLAATARACKTLGALEHVLSDYRERKTRELENAKSRAETIVNEAEKQHALAAADKLAAPPQVAQLHEEVQEVLDSGGLQSHIYSTFVRRRVPQFLYFDEYYQMEGRLNIGKLKQRQAERELNASDRPMLGLIELARLDLDQLANPERTEALSNKLEGASNHLSKQILKYWSQNRHLRVGFDVRPALPKDPEGMREGTNLWGRVHDSVRHVSTQLGTRSKGFIWFFSFLAWFSQQRRKGVPIILLLDEPGLSLHAMAQGDLLNYIEEELVPHHQVIYTSHSPFMIHPERFGRVRIVEDKSLDADYELPEDEQGTKVLIDSLDASDDSLFPLQGALGFDIVQTLFVGPNSLVVEGVSDLLYIQCMTRILEEEGRTGLSSEWTVTPVGGAEKVPTFVALLGSQKKLRIATLIDFAVARQQRIEALFKRKLLKKKNVLTFADFTGKAEADVEDMFDEGFYLELVNREYRADLAKPITAADIKGREDRVLVRIEKFLKANPMSGASFNHFRPARHFAENERSLKPELSPGTLDRFEKAFEALNALLRRADGS